MFYWSTFHRRGFERLLLHYIPLKQIIIIIFIYFFYILSDVYVRSGKDKSKDQSVVW